MNATPSRTAPAWAATVEPWQPLGEHNQARALYSAGPRGVRIARHEITGKGGTVTTHLEGALEGSLTATTDAELAAELRALGAALLELAGIVRGDL